MVNVSRIKVIGLDVDGTVLASDDHDNEMPPRKGLREFFDSAHENGVKIVSSSDANLDAVKDDLESSFRRHKKCRMSLDMFDDFAVLNQFPEKDFSVLIGRYCLESSKELLVIGDSPQRDIGGAIKIGALYLPVPEYRCDNMDSRKFDFSRVLIG